MTRAERIEALRSLILARKAVVQTPYVPPERCNVPDYTDCPGCPACRM